VYRPAEEIAEARQLDPIALARDQLAERSVWDECREAGLTAELKATIDSAVERALAAPEPAPDTLGRYVHAEIA
jgi:2-oxoisovalerate dehydrogenase E1 component